MGIFHIPSCLFRVIHFLPVTIVLYSVFLIIKGKLPVKSFVSESEQAGLASDEGLEDKELRRFKMIAYLILVHRFPNQFKRLFKAIYHPANHYLIHVDKRSGAGLHAEIRDFLAAYPNASLLKSEKAIWGGYSLVDAELRGIKELLKMGLNWEFFINLSAQDFPLKSQNYIHNFLGNNRGKDFLKVSNQSVVRPDTMSRVEYFVSESGDEIVDTPVLKRPFLRGVTPYIGNQWMILSRKFCEFVTDNPEVDRFKKFYQNTFIADEGFFQTVIMNTSYKGTIVNDDKRTIDWVPMGTIKLRPRDFTVKDARFLMSSNDLFARKFDESVDSGILNILEAHISEPLPLPVERSRRVERALPVGAQV